MGSVAAGLTQVILIDGLEHRVLMALADGHGLVLPVEGGGPQRLDVGEGAGLRALEGLSGPEEAIDAFLQKKLRGAELSDPKVRRRAADALARRGYRWEDISAGLRRYGAEPEEW